MGDRRVGGGQLAGLAHERVAAGVLLPAAAVAALAAATAGHDLHVAELARHAEPAALQRAVEQQRAADAGAEVDADEMRLAARRRRSATRPRGGVRVVLDDTGRPQPLLIGLAQRLVRQDRCGEKQHRRAGRVDEAGGADADRVDVVPRGEVEHGVDDESARRPRASCCGRASRGGPARAVALAGRRRPAATFVPPMSTPTVSSGGRPTTAATDEARRVGTRRRGGGRLPGRGLTARPLPGGAGPVRLGDRLGRCPHRPQPPSRSCTCARSAAG